MVGIVIVSHSRKIAEGLEELARSMTPGITVPIAFSGGTGDPHSPLGTDASAVYGAIQAVDSPDGVCIFSDLGSARLAAETAVELFPAEARGRLVCCNAPLVEGVLAAAARAAGGADLPTVLAEAERAKADTSPRQSDTGETDGDEQAGGITLELVLSNPHGLHARPAARMVSLLGRFGCAARLKNSTRANAWADAKSMSGVLTRDARKGDRVLFRFQGEDAQAARSALLELAAEGFGDGSPAEVVARRESEAPSDRTGPAPTALPAALPSAARFATGRPSPRSPIEPRPPPPARWPASRAQSSARAVRFGS